MYGSVAELMANQPDFNQMRIRGGESPYREPVMPGEQRLIPSMQDKLQPALPPVRKAADDLLEEFMARMGGRGNMNDIGGIGGMANMSDMGGMA
jgi:hypothetical protein